MITLQAHIKCKSQFPPPVKTELRSHTQNAKRKATTIHISALVKTSQFYEIRRIISLMWWI